MESVFICNILSMGCISSVLISRKIDSCFPGATQPMRTQLMRTKFRRSAMKK